MAQLPPLENHARIPQFTAVPIGDRPQAYRPRSYTTYALTLRVKTGHCEATLAISCQADFISSTPVRLRVST